MTDTPATHPHGPVAVADFDTGVVRRNIEIAASPATVWAALTSPDAIEQWWGHPVRFPDGVHEGAHGTFEYVGHGLFPLHVVRLDPPRTFAFRWADLGVAMATEDDNLVTFTVEPAGQGARVTVVEEGFTTPDAAARRAAMEDNVQGWNQALDGLAAYVLALA